MEKIKVKLVKQPESDQAWCFNKVGQIFEVYDDGDVYCLDESLIGAYLDYDQCELIN